MNAGSSQFNNDAQTEEFIRLFGLNQGRVFAFITTLLPCWADAEDVLQQTSIVLWQKFDQFDKSADFAKWACGIAYRESLKCLRQKGRQQQAFREVVAEKIAQTRMARSDLHEKRQHKVDDCVAKLPTQDREIIEHYYYRGRRTADQVAKELGRPTNTILKALIRIRKSLQRCVENTDSTEKPE